MYQNVYTEDYGDCHQINGRLNKLNDLKDLTIHSYKGHIEKGILSGLNKLERLNIQYTYLSNDNMKEIIALPNLKELYFYNPEFESDFSFELFKKASNIQTLTVHGNLLNYVASGLVKNLTNVKKLVLNAGFEGIPKFVYDIPNLKKLTVNFREVQLD
ncbi:hypothetical protein BCR32DRAFT_246480 [Anaeromyces robustus]|uniref:RNI-like protein n=1 Tax=Anaeromyces robustus TaxID=1754192 RepID=A0A1Y1X0L9_9FUNG|nr:hypothetical protein BCR32DRAFT_246480 [Anaeromyces robustus]|eukprot:ORX79340.1 hypothetical protein BCR32DRAFT_246480 [Anaeromyces robustus]